MKKSKEELAFATKEEVKMTKEQFDEEFLCYAKRGINIFFYNLLITNKEFVTQAQYNIFVNMFAEGKDKKHIYMTQIDIEICAFGLLHVFKKFVTIDIYYKLHVLCNDEQKDIMNKSFNNSILKNLYVNDILQHFNIAQCLVNCENKEDMEYLYDIMNKYNVTSNHVRHDITINKIDFPLLLSSINQLLSIVLKINLDNIKTILLNELHDNINNIFAGQLKDIIQLIDIEGYESIWADYQDTKYDNSIIELLSQCEDIEDIYKILTTINSNIEYREAFFQFKNKVANDSKANGI